MLKLSLCAAERGVEDVCIIILLIKNNWNVEVKTVEDGPMKISLIAVFVLCLHFKHNY